MHLRPTNKDRKIHMSELGRLLFEARTAKELSLADVEAATRIRQRYLEALENGSYAELPRGAVARGFLRTYARYLGLDVADVMSKYSEESGDTSDEIPIAEPGKPRLVNYRPLEVALMDTRPTIGWWRWVIALVIVAVLAGGSWLMLNYNPGWNLLAALGPVRPTATNTATATPWIVTATPQPTDSPQQPTPTSDLLPLPMPTVPPTITPTPRPTVTPEVVARISLSLNTTQRVWVRVTVDGEVAEEGILEAGETRSWDANHSISIRTGNAGGVSLTLNNEELGTMGNVGQIVERAWIVAQGEITEATPNAITPAPTPTGTPTPAG